MLVRLNNKTKFDVHIYTSCKRSNTDVKDLQQKYDIAQELLQMGN
jgi:hypothetical protein